ncbi:MAG: phosphatase PAP2 family protein [bacterium]
MNLLDFDKSLLISINHSTRCLFLDSISLFFADARPFVPLLVIIWLLLIIRATPQTKRMLLVIPFLISATDILSSGIMKPLFARVRPCHILELTTISSCSESFSFPSGHATNSMAFAFFLFLHKRLLGLCFILLSVFISFTRIYLGLHYPTDIFAGWVIGIFWASFFYIIKERIWRGKSTARIVVERSG